MSSPRPLVTRAPPFPLNPRGINYAGPHAAGSLGGQKEGESKLTATATIFESIKRGSAAGEARDTMATSPDEDN